jgi:aryl-alcohol dehydrogenase-like predicted oxidoreductase
MLRVALPGTGCVVPPVTIGTWGLGGPQDIGGQALGWPALGDSLARSVIRAALDEGLNFIDTADFYGQGRSEEIVGLAVSGRRADAVLASKWGLLPKLDDQGNVDRTFSVAHLTDSLHASLRRLRTDYIDLYQLHGPPRTVLDQDELWLTLESFRQAGKIRSVGVSLRSSDARNPESPWWRCPGIDVWQVPYSPVAGKETVGPRRLAEAREGRPFLLARSVLHHGLLVSPRGPAAFTDVDHRHDKTSDDLVDRVEEFWSSHATPVPPEPAAARVKALLNFALGSGAISSAIVGVTSTEHVRVLAEAVQDDQLRDSVRSRQLHATAARVFG